MNDLSLSKVGQEENDILFNQILERLYFSYFRRPRGKSPHKRIELYLRSACPSNCYYCYLAKYGKELYPASAQKNELILKNLQSVLNWYIKNKFTCSLEIFSGECIIDGLMFQVWDTIYSIFSKVDLEYRPPRIMMPENCDFAEYPELIEKVQKYINNFFKIGIDLSLSASVDGKYMDDNRTRVRSKEFYPNLFKFLEKNDFACHPMVSAHGIEKWIENYKWWQSNEVPYKIGHHLPMLEVRNDDWTPEALEEYSKFLRFIIDWEYKNNYKEDLEAFTYRVFGVDGNPYSNYDNIRISYTPSDNIGGLGCTVQTNFFIRLGDLAIVECHRTSYDKFVNGFFRTDENGEIIGLKAENLAYMVACNSYNKKCAPKCCDCIIKNFCGGPCFGANYEASGESFITPESVCKMHKTKMLTLAMVYEKMGVLDLAENLEIKLEAVHAVRDLLKFYEGGLDKLGRIQSNNVYSTICKERNSETIENE